MTIHIVDDEVSIAECVAEILRKHDGDVRCFSSAEDYLLHVDSDGYVEPSLVISDVRMPGMDGFELIKILKSNGLKAKVMIMSGFNASSEQSHHGIDYMLSKPFHPDKLLVVVAQLLGQHEVGA